MRVTRHFPRKHLASPTGIRLLLALVLFAAGGVALPSAGGLGQPSSAHATQPLVIEGEVERIVSEMHSGGLITSRATIAVTNVLQGTLKDDKLTVGYEGGTVGDLALKVSTEPYLVEGMVLRAKLAPGRDGDYRIANPDADLTILGEIGALYVPTGQTWDDTDIPVPFRINPNTGDVPGDGERTAVQNALATWTNASCSYFAYSYQGSCSATSQAQDGVNCVSWSPSSGGGALAKSFWWFQGSRIIESDIVFYDSYSWSTNPGVGQYDVESVALHELGHSLGLGHSSYSSAVMWYSILAGVERRSLHFDDRDGVCALYPGPIPDPPGGLVARSVPPTQIDLSWTDNSDNEDGFKIERSTDGFTWPDSYTVEANVTTYSDSSVACNQRYHYRVIAYNPTGDSAPSNTDDAIPADVYEIDDAYTDAKPVSIQGAPRTQCFYYAGDEDWVQLPVLPNLPYTITTSNLGTSTDTYLELYGLDGTTVLTSNNDCPGTAPASCINNWSNVTGGIYFIRVIQLGGAAGGCTGYEYDLSAVVSGAERFYLPLAMR
jgi:hypothetical protein